MYCQAFTAAPFTEGIQLYSNEEKPSRFIETDWYLENKKLFKTFGRYILVWYEAVGLVV